MGAKRGHVVTEETRKKISIAHKGKPHLFLDPLKEQERRRKIGVAVKKRYEDPKEHEKTSKSMVGKIKRTPEYCKQVSERLKLIVGEKHPLFGIPKSEETKKKISIANTGKKRTIEQRKKISETNKNRKPYPRKPHSELAKQHMSESHKGKPSSKRGCSLEEPQKIKLMDTIYGGFWYGNVKYYELKYCDLWTANLRSRVRAWYGYQCVECGALWIPGMRRFHVHHIWYNKRTCCDDTPRSLVLLCGHCHGHVQVDHDYWSQHFQDMIDSYYNGRCWLTKEEMKLWSL